MEAAGRKAGGRWGTAVALAAALLFFPALDSFPLVALALSVLLLALPPHSFRMAVFGAAIATWVLLLFPARGSWALVGCGWALVVGGLFAFASVIRPGWSFTSRALAAVAAATAGAGVWLGVGGAWDRLDWLVGEHFHSAGLLVAGAVVTQFPEATWAPEFASAILGSAAWLQAVFPALVALQSLAALGLAWWAFTRAGPPEDVPWRVLKPLRDFRFNDQLVWLMIAGLVPIVFPFGPVTARAGTNVLLFMGSLYALRGIAVFVFLAGKSPSRLSVVLGTLAMIFFAQIVLTAALLVGLGDTWLDVRGRVTAAANA